MLRIGHTSVRQFQELSAAKPVFPSHVTPSTSRLPNVSINCPRSILLICQRPQPNTIARLSDCAVCIKGYGRSLNGCHSCEGTTASLLVIACALFSLAMILLFVLAFVFLVGGLDAINLLRQSMVRKLSRVVNIFRCRCRVRERVMPGKTDSDKGAILDVMEGTIPPEFDCTLHMNKHKGGEGGPEYSPGSTTLQPFDNNGPDITCIQPVGVRAGPVAGVKRSNVAGRQASSSCDEARPASRHTRHTDVPGVGVPGVGNGVRLESYASGGGMTFRCGVLGKKISRWTSRVPLEKFKILVVVWQILAVFSGVTGVEFPASYSLFLSWINILNFDVGYVLSASCVLPSVNYYHRLLATTLAPFIMAAGLAFTYRAAKRRAGIGSAGVAAREAAWSRHVTAGLLLTFLVSDTIVLRSFR